MYREFEYFHNHLPTGNFKLSVKSVYADKANTLSMIYRKIDLN